MLDCRAGPLYDFRYPYRGYADFAAVPPVVAQALLFIENRDLLDENRPTLNPAVDWVRFARAAAAQVGRMVKDDLDAPGGSTLATQIEKYRHSPDGITYDAREKLRQMVSASVRAYREGEQTLPVRRNLVLDYLNTVPLSAAPGHGEVNGLGDGLWVWFGADFERVNELLSAPEGQDDTLKAQGLALRQVVALMIAHRRPSWYLARGREELTRTTDAYLRLLTEAGSISPAMRDAALSQPLLFRDLVANPAVLPANPGKGTTAVRARLAGMLGTSLYSLDRLDAEVDTTLHGGLQQAVGAYLNRLSDADFARSQGLIGDRMLNPATLGAVRYSFTLVERTPGGNRVRVQTDTTDQPLDINEGSKLELGSTAKLRVLTTYLEIVAELHGRLAELDVPALRQVEVARQDNLTRWAIDHLATASDRSLPAMLEAALERRFSASPAENFFTGGGVHTFGNFNRSDDAREPTLREALRASINLPFVRLMREIVRHTMYQVPGSTARLMEDAEDPRRAEYLARFADREGQTFLRRFWRKYQGRSPEEMRTLLLDGLRPSAERLAAVFRYLEPEAPPEALAAFLGRRLGDAQLSESRIAQLYTRHAPEAFDLPDRGYVARVHPLELWLVGYRMRNPQASLSEAVAASADERQVVYRWLFRTRSRSAGFADLHDARGRGLPRHPPPLGAAGLPLRPSRAFARHRARQLGRPPGGAGRADGHHRERRCTPVDAAHRPRALRHRHALRNRLFGAARRGRAGDGARGGGGAARRAVRRGRERHRAQAGGQLPSGRWQRADAGRQDRHRRQPHRHRRPPRHGAEPHRHLRLLPRPAPLRLAHCLRDRPQRRRLSLHFRAAGADPEVDGASAGAAPGAGCRHRLPAGGGSAAAGQHPGKGRRDGRTGGGGSAAGRCGRGAAGGAGAGRGRAARAGCAAARQRGPAAGHPAARRQQCRAGCREHRGCACAGRGGR